MGFEDFQPIFGDPRVEWSGSDSVQSRPFLFHVHATDPSHLAIHVTDFHSNTWEAVRSVLQLEDMRDDVGIGGSWSEFMDYVTASLKSRDVKLVLGGDSNSDTGASTARLVAQKAKGMPVISISLAKLAGSAASSAIANLSLQLFKAFKSTHELYVEEQARSILLDKMISAERERSESIQRQLEQYSKRQKLVKANSPNKGGVSASSNNGLQSPEKQEVRDTGSTKVTSRVVLPACRRARVRGVFLQDTEDDDDSKKH